MDKIDFKKKDKALYSGKVGRFDIIEVPELQYLMIDGKGDPDKSLFSQATTALYALSYNLKFYSKNELERDYVVPPLEGLWWAEDMNSFANNDKEQWQWTLMIRQPEWIYTALLESLRPKAIAKQITKKEPTTDRVTLEAVRLESLNEGLCVQILHIGSYNDEGPVLEQMHNHFIPSKGCRMVGKHHEVYLSDPRKVASEKLKTLLRQPVQKS